MLNSVTKWVGSVKTAFAIPEMPVKPIGPQYQTNSVQEEVVENLELKMSDLNFYFAALSLCPPLIQEKKTEDQSMPDAAIIDELIRVASDGTAKEAKISYKDHLEKLHKTLDAYRCLVTNTRVQASQVTALSPCGTLGDPLEQAKDRLEEDIRGSMRKLNLLEKFERVLEMSETNQNTSLHQSQMVVPGVWIGSHHTACSRIQMLAKRITHILCCAPLCGPPPFPKHYKYLMIPVEDTVNESIIPWFDRASTFIRQAVDSNGNVLVHCGAGISRAPAFCCAFLIQELRVPSSIALAIVRTARPHIKPNKGFLAQLKIYTEYTLSRPKTEPIKSYDDFLTRELSCSSPISKSAETKDTESKMPSSHPSTSALDESHVRSESSTSLSPTMIVSKLRNIQSDSPPSQNVYPTSRNLQTYLHGGMNENLLSVEPLMQLRKHANSDFNFKSARVFSTPVFGENTKRTKRGMAWKFRGQNTVRVGPDGDIIYPQTTSKNNYQRAYSADDVLLRPRVHSNQQNTSEICD